MSDVPTFEVVVERHNRRSSAESIASTREEAFLDILRAYATVHTWDVGAVEIQHNDSDYSVTGIVVETDRSDQNLEIDETDRGGVLNAGGIEVTVSR